MKHPGPVISTCFTNRELLFAICIPSNIFHQCYSTLTEVIVSLSRADWTVRSNSYRPERSEGNSQSIHSVAK